MKIYKIWYDDETYWVSADGVAQALAHFLEEKGADDIDSCVEVPPDKWDDMAITYHDVPDDDGDPVEISFRQFMENDPGVQIFCSTEFN